MINRRSLLAASAASLAASRYGAQAASGIGNSDYAAAFLIGFPLFEFARTAWAVAGRTLDRPQGNFNRVTHRRKLTDPTSRIITTPNNDCLVSTARIDLSTGPLLLGLPDIHDRYFSVVFMDAFTDNFFFVGTRATGGRGGKFLITPPGWRGVVPAGVRRIAAPTTDVWMLARILVEGPQDYTLVNALQDRIILTGLDSTLPAGKPIPVPPGDVKNPGNFLAVANAMLGRAPPRDPRVMRAARHVATGLRRGDVGAYARLDPLQQARWRTTIAEQLTALPKTGEGQSRDVDHWRYSLPTTGHFGDDDLQRAVVALIGLAALPPEEAFYGHALSDADGAPFDGAHHYRLHLPAGGPPVDAFWSITLYRIEADGRLFLAPNAIDRYSVGDRTRGLVRNADGSLDIWLQHEQPEPARTANWLPVPQGPFRPALRAYLPKPALLNLRWKMPAITRLA